MEGGGTEDLIFVGLEFGGHFFVSEIWPCRFCKQNNVFFFVSMDSIDYFYKRTSVFGRFDRRLLLCLCFTSVFVRVAI